jgi:Asp-tRNA(Asn)/Glu-tRNA(Gln) amidotransferase A subunit family amidase
MRFRRLVTRRDFLATSGRIAAATVAATHAGWTLADQQGSELTDLSAIQAATAIRQGDIKAEDYAAALLARCETGKHLNAFISLEADRVMEAARAADQKRASGAALGALHGVPLAVKDNMQVIGYPTTAGTKALIDFRPKTNAPVAAALLRQGAICLGKTNMHELALGFTSMNQAFGIVRNPYDPARMPGGSSGGTGAAVAARMTPAGLGSDTNGSIRLPSSMCGIAGLRPSSGRYAQAGIVPLSSTQDTAGPMARTVSDLLLLDAVITGEAYMPASVDLSGVRLGISPKHYYADLDSSVAEIMQYALDRLKDAGATLVEADIPNLTELQAGVTVNVIYYELRRVIAQYLAAQRTGISFDDLVEAASPEIQTQIKGWALEWSPNAISEQVYRKAIDETRPRLQATYRNYFRENDITAVIFPTLKMPAPLIPEIAVSPGPDVEVNGKPLAMRVAFARNIAPCSSAGIPGLVIPAGITPNGLPVGLELDGPAWKDRELLALGLAVERVLGTIPSPQV